MDKWFEELILDVIWKAVQDALGELAGMASDAIEAKLSTLQTNQPPLSTSPLVQVVDADSSSLTFLIRGRQKLFKGAAAPFLRIQVKVSRSVDDQLNPPISVLEWQSVVGDLQITKEGVFTAELGIGFSDGAWLGRGAFKIVPAGFGLDLLLGGLDERGLMVGIDIDLPSPIPLGTSGVVLTDVGGDFAYNFVPRLNAGAPKLENGSPVPWDAGDYVAWAKDPELDRWQPGPPDETAVGIGLRAGFGDISTLGWLMSLNPIGLAVLTPGPIFILGGKGRLLNTDSIKAEGYAAVDIPSGSIALGLALEASEPADGDFKFLEAHGSLDAFFSFQRPSDWFVHFGTQTSPVAARILEAIDADVFLMLGHGALPAPDGKSYRDGVFFGAGLAIGGSWEWWILKVTAKYGARVTAGVGWNPLEFQGKFVVYGELGLAVWEFEFKIVLKIDLTGHVPSPTLISGEISFELNLPWPIPDIDGSLPFSLGDSGNEPPVLQSPLLVGSNA